LLGNAGDDTLAGGTGADTLTGGSGSDVFQYTAIDQSSGATVDTITDFSTTDDQLQFTLNYGSLISAVTVNAIRVTAGAGVTEAQASLTGERGQYVYDTTASKLYVNVNNDNLLTSLDYAVNINAASTATATVANTDINFIVTGTALADVITTDGGNDTISGGTGGDSITAGAGNDSITGGTGADTILGGDGADTIVSGGGTDVITGGAGIDVIDVGSGTSRLNTHTTATAVNRDTVTNFTVGTDLLGLVAANTEVATAVGAVAVVEDEAVAAANANGAAYNLAGLLAGNLNTLDLVTLDTATLANAANANLALATDGTELLKALVAAGAGSTASGLTVGAATNAFYLAVDDGTNGYLYYIAAQDNTLVIASEIALIAVFTAGLIDGVVAAQTLMI
jgi:Ca2+-binding RTX toxin-like protein